MLETSPNQMNLRELAVTTALSVLTTSFSYHFLDARLTHLAAGLLDTSHLAEEAAGIPDILFLLVLATTITSWAMFLFLGLRPIRGISRSLFLSLGLAVPFSFIMKNFLKYVFGRPIPKAWLYHHESFGFHWLQGGTQYNAFPSGHMAVFTAIMFCLSRYYPGYKNISFIFLTLLGLALVLTNHHFLSDVTAGFLVGVASEWITKSIVPGWRSGYELRRT